MNNILSDLKKFTAVNSKGSTLLNFAVNQEKHVDKVLRYDRINKEIVKTSR